MEVFEAIAARHSYRGAFLNTPVPKADLEKIVHAGIRAPSGHNAQTTSFAIVDDPQLIKALGELVPKTSVKTAQAIIAVISKRNTTYKGMSFDVQDYSAAVENMLLAITALGYATVWLDGVLHYNQIDEKIGELLHLPKGQDMLVSVILPIGVPEESKSPTERLPFEERAWYNLHP